MGFRVEEPAQVREYYEDALIVDGYLKRRLGTCIGRILHDRQVSAVRALIVQHAPKTVVEVACGPGRITRHLEGKFRGIAVDNSAEMLARAKKVVPKNWSVRKGDAFSLRALGRADMVITFRFLRHFDRERRAGLLRAFRVGGTARV